MICLEKEEKMREASRLIQPRRRETTVEQRGKSGDRGSFGVEIAAEIPGTEEKLAIGTCSSN